MSEKETSRNRNPAEGTWRLSKVFLRFRSFGASLFPPLVFGSLVLGGWYLVSYGILDESRRFLLQPPHKVLTYGFLDWGGRDGMAEMLDSLWSSTKVAGIGLFFAIYSHSLHKFANKSSPGILSSVKSV